MNLGNDAKMGASRGVGARAIGRGKVVGALGRWSPKGVRFRVSEVCRRSKGLAALGRRFAVVRRLRHQGLPHFGDGGPFLPLPGRTYLVLPVLPTRTISPDFNIALNNAIASSYPMPSSLRQSRFLIEPRARIYSKTFFLARGSLMIGDGIRNVNSLSTELPRGALRETASFQAMLPQTRRKNQRHCDRWHLAAADLLHISS